MARCWPTSCWARSPWDDAKIAALNRGVALPSKSIVRIVREDASGSTEGFVRYLVDTSPAFKAVIPVSNKPSWPGKVVAAKGNDGVVAALKNTFWRHHLCVV